ncbi:hypothetical protein AK812_SmicGene18672 [Symbiodinium microadriaticum]|uniref:Uncharacterized protein n=1 Tax=Symbiodinium microadriaticum TaxID=2951 RepID=A0A1Q9DUI1_SYMMI|nr:hypothetical protein AK812_SmicGene18672 [Symbiodinium microadriaticum]
MGGFATGQEAMKVANPKDTFRKMYDKWVTPQLLKRGAYNVPLPFEDESEPTAASKEKEKVQKKQKKEKRKSKKDKSAA